jgi:hypothetical protein
MNRRYTLIFATLLAARLCAQSPIPPAVKSAEASVNAEKNTRACTFPGG